LKILELLNDAGEEVSYHDPHLPHLPDKDLSSVKLTKEELVQADCVVIATNHEALDLHSTVKFSKQIVDLRNAVRNEFGKMPANVEVL